MSMDITPKIIDQVKDAALNSKAVRAALLNQMQHDMSPFVPWLHGYLCNHSFVHDSQIIYVAPYAKAQFYGIVNGYPVKHYTTPGTGRRWDLVATAKYKEDWQKVAADAIKEATNRGLS